MVVVKSLKKGVLFLVWNELGDINFMLWVIVLLLFIFVVVVGGNGCFLDGYWLLLKWLFCF